MIDPELLDDALCAQTDPEIFFPEQGKANALAKSICAKCPISLACLNDALLLAPDINYGIWGGTSSQERTHLQQDPTALEQLRKMLKVRDRENREALNLTIIRGE